VLEAAGSGAYLWTRLKAVFSITLFDSISLLISHNRVLLPDMQHYFAHQLQHKLFACCPAPVACVGLYIYISISYSHIYIYIIFKPLHGVLREDMLQKLMAHCTVSHGLLKHSLADLTAASSASSTCLWQSVSNLPHSLTHSLTHSLNHSLTHSPTHSLTH